MKVRNGFVSNSSTSSFICDICGEVESGYDMSPEEAGMFACEKGHYIHHKCIENMDKAKQYNEVYIKDFLKELRDHQETDDYDSSEMDKKYCPICQKVFINDSDLLEYIVKKNNIDITDIRKEIRKNYSKGKK